MPKKKGAIEAVTLTNSGATYYRLDQICGLVDGESMDYQGTGALVKITAIQDEVEPGLGKPTAIEIVNGGTNYNIGEIWNIGGGNGMARVTIDDVHK